MFTMQLCCLVILTLLASAFAQQQPQIVSAPQTIVVNVGQTAMLKCQVANLGNNKLSWSSVSHNYVIYDGDQLVADNRTKYRLIKQAGGQIQNLQISYVTRFDQGFYKCAIEGTDEQMITHLDVSEVPNIILPKGTPMNKTDCCLIENVTQSCLPGCYPSQIDLEYFNATVECGTIENLKGLSKCFTDGSNHDNCCLNLKVSPLCLGFCHSSVPDNLNSDVMNTCFTDIVINRIFACFEIGFDHLPSEPTEVKAIAAHDGHFWSIIVKWSEPKKNPQNVTGYRIMYKPRNQSVYNSTLVTDPRIHDFRLTGDKFNIQPDMDYKIHVSAVADLGASFGSVEVDIYIPDYSQREQMNTDIATCCSNRTVEEKCNQRLCHSRTWSEFNTEQILECFTHLNDVFACLVGERNHTNCCAAFDVTSECLPLCSGHPPAMDMTLMGCVSQMGIIEACVQQGYYKLIAPPTQVTVENVESTTATVVFMPSSSSDLNHYLVELRTGDENAPFIPYTKLQTSENVIHLDMLSPNTYYWVRIISVGEQGESLPSETVSFLTYPENYNDPSPPPVTNIPHNFTECCMNHNMPKVCYEGCDYSKDIKSYYKDIVLTCLMHFSDVLACSADGRDHSDCCKSRGIQPQCIELCSYNGDFPLDSSAITCASDINEAAICFREGIVDLPRYPDVVVTNFSKHSISLKWEQPKTSGIIDSYIIAYEVSGSDKEINVTTNKTFIILQNLKPGTFYEIFVVSNNSNGTSAPSPIILQATESDGIPVPTYNTTEISERALWQNISHCCENSVSAECLDQCRNKQTTVPQIDRCLVESHKMLACYADGQDHRFCCQQRNLPSTCVSLCGGIPPTADVTMATCMSYAHRDIVLSCFLENKDLIPEAPLDFNTIQMGTEGLVNLTWSTPKRCGASCTYTVHYWKENEESNIKNQNNIISNTAMITVTPGSWYTFTVTANNEYGSSSPAAWRTLFVRNYEKDVKVFLRGNLQWVEMGQLAILDCALIGFDPDDSYTIEWFFNTRRKLDNDGKKELTILHVDPITDEGSYTCSVTDSSGIPSSDTLFLVIQYAPKFDHFDQVFADASNNKKAQIACLFHGVPQSDPNNWQKDMQQLPQNMMKFSSSRLLDISSGITTYRLHISDVVEVDYGLYSLNVSNSYGVAECHVNFTNPTDIQIKPPKPYDFQQCCKNKNVDDVCMELCGFHVNITEIVRNTKYISCLQYFETYLQCGADGRDHSKCCNKRGVLPLCVPLCSGVIPKEKLNSELLRCVAEQSVIFSCAQEGHRLLPHAPENVTVSYRKEDNSILVKWKEPHLTADKVDHYTVYYNYTGHPDPISVSLSESVTEYYIRNVKPQTVYGVWMTAGNAEGSSLATLATSVSTIDIASGTTATSKTSDVEEETVVPNYASSSSEDENTDRVALGVGITVAIVAVIAIIVVVYIFRNRLFKPGVSKSVTFENLSYGNQGQVKIHGVDEQYGYGRLQEESSQEVQNVRDTSSAGEPSTDSNYENPMYKIHHPSGSSRVASSLETHS